MKSPAVKSPAVSPLTERFDGAAEVLDEIAAREPDTRDYLSETRRIVDTYHPRRLHLIVAGIVDETPTTKTFRFKGVDRESLPPFLAGQYVNVFIDGTSRPFAISSSPTRLDHYDLTVRRVPGGRISNMLIDTVNVGETLTTTGPMGTFFHNPLFHGSDVVFLAGGSGVAPAMSMIREIADRGPDRRFRLVYGSREADDIIFHDELDQLAATHPNIEVHHVIGDLLTADTITESVGHLDGRMVYVCGPQVFYPFALEQLTALGHPRRRIRFEANGAPADPSAEPGWPADVDADGLVTVTVDGSSFQTPRSRPLLDALEDNGIRPEAACRSGECSLCRVRVCEGQVYTAPQAKLRMSDARSGYTHSCVAYPISDVELEF